MKNKNMLVSGLVLIILTNAACSNRAVYENMQSHERDECLKLSPTPIAYEDCMKRANTPYDEYVRQREDAIQREE